MFVSRFLSLQTRLPPLRHDFKAPAAVPEQAMRTRPMVDVL